VIGRIIGFVSGSTITLKGLVPFKCPEPDDKTYNTKQTQYQCVKTNLGDTGSLNEYTACGISHHGEGEFLDDRNNFIREVMIAEKYTGKNCHGQNDDIDQSRSDP